MNHRLIAMILAFCGTVFMLAMAFDIMANNLALFLAIVCYAASGLASRLPLSRNDEHNKELQ